MMVSLRLFVQRVVVVALLCQPAVAGENHPLVRSPYNPDAKRVYLFDGMRDGQVSVQVVPRGAEGGTLLLANQTEEPLTVCLPAGFVGVPISPQPGPFGPGVLQAVPGGGLQGQGQANGNSGAAGVSGIQRFGGGTGGTTSGGANSAGLNGNNVIPNGFFSIPPGKTLRIPYASVCLNHGLNEPTSRTRVRLIPLEEYTSDPVLKALIEQVGTEREHHQALQAAVWHIANGLSWQDLARKSSGPTPVPGSELFSPAQLQTARNLVTQLQNRFPVTEQVASAPPRQSGTSGNAVQSASPWLR